MKKLKLTSISGNSKFASDQGDRTACMILHDMGFRLKDHKTGHTIEDDLDSCLYIGAYPKDGTEFFVYYDGPLGDVEAEGKFRLVRIDQGNEVELDSGKMSLGHYNKGTRPTYYGKGKYLPSYSFHISFTEAEARRNAIKPITIVMIEDSQPFADALKKVLDEQKKFPCQVIVLNPNRPEPPTFEQFHDEICGHLNGFRDLVLMDKHLGEWKWSGAHLAPSFPGLVAISTDQMSWAQFNFTGKTMIAYHNNEAAKVTFVETILEALKKSTSPELMQELVEYQQIMATV